VGKTRPEPLSAPKYRAIGAALRYADELRRSESAGRNHRYRANNINASEPRKFFPASARVRTASSRPIGSARVRAARPIGARAGGSAAPIAPAANAFASARADIPLSAPAAFPANAAIAAASAIEVRYEFGQREIAQRTRRLPAGSDETPAKDIGPISRADIGGAWSATASHLHNRVEAA